MAPFEIKWQAPEYEFRQKGVSWYWVSIIVAVAVLGLAVWQKNFLFGFFVVVAEILILAWANREPPSVNFTLNEKGLSVSGRKSYSYAEMESWSIDDFGETDWPSLFFQFQKRLKPPLKIKISKNQIADVKKALKDMLPQVEHEHSMLDTLEEFIGF